MDDTENPDPGTEFTSESSWTLGPDSDRANCFFSNHRENSILSEFGWNLQSDEPARFMDLDPVEAEERSDLAGNIEIQRLQGASPAGSGGGADVSTSNYPSVSSSSSEDQPDKSTGSGGKPPEIP
jgi:hypothetical protein